MKRVFNHDRGWHGVSWPGFVKPLDQSFFCTIADRYSGIQGDVGLIDLLGVDAHRSRLPFHILWHAISMHLFQFL